MSNKILHRLAFASPEVSITLAFATVNSWYFYFLVNIIDIVPYLAGIAFVIGRIIDGVLDPIIGKLSDNLASRYGRKMLTKIGLVPAAVLFSALWILPNIVEGEYFKFIIASITFTIFSIGYTLITVPRLAFLPHLETTPHGRTIQIGYNMVFIFCTLLIATAGIPAAITIFDDSKVMSTTSPLSWALVAISISLMMIIFYLPFLAITREVKPKINIQIKNEIKSFPKKIKKAISGRFIANNILFSFCVFSLTMMQAILPFFLENYIGLSTLEHPIILGTVFATSLIFFPIWVYIGKNLGKLKSLILGAILYLIFLFMVILISPSSGITPYLLICGVLAGVGISALSIFPWALVPDCVEYLCNRIDENYEGLATSIFTFNNKCTGALAVLAVSGIISLKNSKFGLEIEQEYGLSLLFFGIGIIPMFMTIGVILLAVHLAKNNKAL